MKKAEFRLQFYKNYKFNWIPYFLRMKLVWKDKFDSPRCEIVPFFRIEWMWFGVRGTWGDDQYWEQWLWIYKYHNGNYEEAKQDWGWVDMTTRKSTWIDY